MPNTLRVTSVASFILAILAAMAWAAPATAAGPLDASLNNIAATTLEAGRFNLRLGGRYFGSNDFSWGGSVRAGLPFGLQASIAFNSFEADNDDTLGTDMVVSRWNGLELSLKKNLIDNKDGALGIQVGAELRNSKAIIQPTRVSTVDSSTVWSFAVPLSWNARENVRVEGTLKGAFFPDRLKNSAGSTVEGYGDLIGATLGATVDLSERLSIAGDAMAVLRGDNSITDDTGATGDQVVWSASAVCHATEHLDAEAFLTNSGGTSLVTSMLGSSGTDSVFAGLRFGYTF